MTKTIEKLTELRNKAQEIAMENPTKIALEVKNSYTNDVNNLKATEEYKDMGTKGRIKMEDKLRSKFQKELFELLAEQKAEYKKLVDEAKTLAKTTLTTPNPTKADALTVQLFEREMQSLQTSILLGMNANTSIKTLNEFIVKHSNDPYFANVIRNSFAQISQNILTLESTPEIRDALAKQFAHVEMKSTTTEQKLAEQTLQAFGNGEPKFYREAGVQYAALSEIIGKGHANFLNNPTAWLESQAQADKSE